MTRVSAYDLIFLAALAAVLLVLYVATGRKPGTLVEGADGRASTSKFQFALWTAVVISSYLAILVTRFLVGVPGAVEQELPVNVLVAMGLSATTLAAAKGITVSYIGAGQTVKTPAKPGEANAMDIFKDDLGVPDLSKIQMVIWTCIAAGVYIARIIGQLNAATHHNPPILSDIEPAFMVLMGLGQGAYLGKKLVTTTTPRLTGLSPSAARPPAQLTLSGSSFGASQDGSQITVDGQPLSVAVQKWQDTQIEFEFPTKRPDNTDWPTGQRALIGLIVGGQESANTLPFSVGAPQLTRVVPVAGPPGITLKLNGTFFGKEQGNSLITVNGLPSNVQATTWTESQIDFTLPATDPTGILLSAGRTVSIGLIVDGCTSSTTVPFKVT